MGDVLEFPSQQARGLAFLDRQLREMLAARGADDSLADFAARELTSLYSELRASEQYSFSVELPDSVDPQARDSLQRQIEAGLEGIYRENHALLVRLAARLLLARVKLFQHERDDPPAPN